MLTIALDYDDTYTADPRMWATLIPLMRIAGHQVIFCTQRASSSVYGQQVRDAVERLDCPIVFASGVTKYEACRAQGYQVDIVIDDSPLAWHTARTYLGPVLTPSEDPPNIDDLVEDALGDLERPSLDTELACAVSPGCAFNDGHVGSCSNIAD